MPYYLDPKSDLVFKRIFGEHPKLLISFLNAVLPLPEDCLIERVEYLSPENVPELEGFKYSIVDVRCFDDKGRHFVVEMQMEWANYFVKRMVYNTAFAYVHQLKKGEKYRKLAPVYGLALVDGVFSKEKEWYHHYRFSKVDNHDEYFDAIQLIFIELPKLQPTSIAQKKLALMWLRFLKEVNEDTSVVDHSLLEVEPIKEALSIAEKGAYSEGQLLAYERYQDAVRTGILLMEDKYEKGLEKGLEDGRAKGHAEGRAEGRAEGLADGEMKAKQAIIQNLYRAQMPLEQIASMVALPVEELQKIIKPKNVNENKKFYAI